MRVVRLLIPLLLVAAVIVGVVSVVSARPDLNNSKHDVAQAWTPLASELGPRYAQLAAADTKLQSLSGPVRQLADEVHTAVVAWQQAQAHGTVADQVRTANNLEALGRRLVTTARASARVQGNAPVVSAVDAFAGDTTFGEAAGLTTVADFNRAVRTYEQQRRGPVRGVVARVLGDDDIPSFAPAPT